tara:strand:- start:1781 stop:2059 length:279 start_codon:yes stop_codon:yes gene_type:complete
MPDQLEKNMQKALKNLKVSDLTKVREVDLPFDKELQKLAETMKKKIQKKEMGGEVMDMTKSEPVNMMDGGPVKKMNMGGVIGGRGGKFKGMR